MMLGEQLQKAIYAALTAAPAVASGAVYDDVPENAGYPRVTIGEEQVLDDGTACSDGWEVFVDINVWSRTVGFIEAKQIAAIVDARIRAIDTVADFTVIDVSLSEQQRLRDPDGKTRRVACTYRFLIDPA